MLLLIGSVKSGRKTVQYRSCLNECHTEPSKNKKSCENERNGSLIERMISTLSIAEYLARYGRLQEETSAPLINGKSTLKKTSRTNTRRNGSTVKAWRDGS